MFSIICINENFFEFLNIFALYNTYNENLHLYLKKLQWNAAFF